MQTAEMDPDIRPGSAIYTQDVQYLGDVGEIQGGSFQVRARMQPDYWLSLHSVTRATDDRVAVAFYFNELDSYRRLSPAA